MDSMEVLQRFCLLSPESKKDGEAIIKQKPFQYEEEYGKDFVHYSDEDLMDLFLYKMKLYKPSVMSVIFGRYKRFYDYCAAEGYRKTNPFFCSKYLSYDYLVAVSADCGNIPYYSREYVRKRCGEAGYNTPYYKSIALSVFEGVKNYPELMRIRLEDVDMERKCIRFGGEKLSITGELAAAYREMRRMEYFETARRKLPFDESSPLLIRPVLKGKDGRAPDNIQLLANTCISKMKSVGLNAHGLYHSGIMEKVVKRFGREKVISFLLFDDDTDKSAKMENNRELEAFFRKNRIQMTGRDFVFDYKGYGLLLKYGRVM